MTKELLNEFMNALIDGTLFGICFCFWMMIVIAVWRWFLGIVKRFLHWLNPKWFKSKTEETDKNCKRLI